MGYTTKFTGFLRLSRKLTIQEAKTLLDIADLPRPDAKAITGTNSYLQWVPTETLDAIVWDGGEKFYDYEELLRWLCGWLKERGVEAIGEFQWVGEDLTDIGRLEVFENKVNCIIFLKPATLSQYKPLTMRKLAEIALEQATGGEGGVAHV